MKKIHIFLIIIFIFTTSLIGCYRYSDIYATEQSPATPLPVIQKIDTKNTAAPEEGSTSAPSEPTYINVVCITEVSSSGKDWIEFYNPGNEQINLSKYKLGNSDDFTKAVALPDILLNPGDYCCVYGKDEAESIKADFSINKEGESIFLFHADGSTVSKLNVPALYANCSYVFINGSWAYTYRPTPGKANTTPAFDSPDPIPYDNDSPIIINEVLVSNKHSVIDSYGCHSDFIEIYNPSDTPISLDGWFLSDSSSNLTKWSFPNISIASKQYIVIFLSGQDSTESELHASFGINPEEEIVLFDGNSKKYSVFHLPDILISDISVGPGNAYYRFPSPGFANTAEINDIAHIGYYFDDDVYISEVYAFGDELDWVEIYNGSGDSIDLSGWHLTDDLDDPMKFEFKHKDLMPGEYYVIEASSHTSLQNDSVAKFGISISGKTLYLIDAEGGVRDIFKTGMMDGSASSGRIEGNTEIYRVFFTVSTPGAKNSSSYITGRTQDPIFSVTSLYCTEKFNLTISAEEGAQIYYTSDGSAPEASSKLLYSGPISIKKNTVIRAIAVKDGYLSSNVVTYTYLFEEPHSIPVVCIAMSPGDKNAVWSAKSKQSKTKVEREGFLSYYEDDGKLGVSFPAGFKPKGAGTLGRSQASLSIHLRGKYGQSNVTYPFFSEYGWETYASLVVRNSGQDYAKARIRDSLASRICFGLNIDVSATKPVAVYVNGEYYGLYDLNEDQNADYLHTHYGVDTRTVEIIRFNTVVVKGSGSNWKRVIEYAKTKNFKSDEVYNEFLQWVDPDFFMDYLICSIYLCNSDMANQKYWHTTDNTIRWRPILYDFDYAIGFNRSAKSSIIERFFDPDGTATATSRVYTYIACALVKNPGWRQRFIERYIELTYTVFAPSRVNTIIDQLVSEMEPEMPRHISRWSSRKAAPASIREWHDNIDSIKDWFSQRQKYAIDSLKKYFHISDEEIERIKAKYV